ncbi:MAG: hypothetical protein U5K31_02815 [Balneolaceae bacterium]|nr:hypothetical protein [Balneolaceae bacterium]
MDEDESKGKKGIDQNGIEVSFEQLFFRLQQLLDQVGDVLPPGGDMLRDGFSGKV